MYSTLSSLHLNREVCTGCGRCLEVCPQAVFVVEQNLARIHHSQGCMECGACQLNCPVQAIRVETGVGCASALIHSAFTGKAPNCGCGDAGESSGCCG